jgi:imidazolonepropionase-like amidohydrolase
MKRILLGLVGIVFAAGTSSAETVYIHAGQLLAVPGEGYLEAHTLVIEDGQIADVAKGYLEPDEDDARVIDLKQAHILPGLIDSHVHLLGEWSPQARWETVTQTASDEAISGAEHARTTLMAGFTTVQDVGGTNDAIFALRDGVAAGKVAGPRIRAAGRAIAVTGGHGDINGFSPAVMALFTGDNICNGRG